MHPLVIIFAIILVVPFLIAGLSIVVAALPLLLPVWGMYWLFTTPHEFKGRERITLFYIFVGVQFVFPLFYLQLIEVRYVIMWWVVLLLLVGGWLLLHPYFRAKVIYDEKLAEWAAVKRITPEEATARYNAIEYYPKDEWLTLFVRTLSAEIYKDAYVETVLPPPPMDFDLKYQVDSFDAWKKLVTEFQPKAADDEIKWRAIPDAVCASIRIFFDDFPPDTGKGFTIPIMDSLPNVGRKVAAVMSPFWTPEFSGLGLGQSIRDTWLNNIARATRRKLTSNKQFDDGVRIYPESYPGDGDEIVNLYLTGLYHYHLFKLPRDFGFRPQLRGEHGVIVAGSGGGKTQFLETMIANDLEQDDPPGMVVIDSKNTMIKRIAHLAAFQPGGRLHDRLIIIDPRDAPALNMFDINIDRLDHSDPATQEHLLNNIVDSFTYFFGALLGSELSNRMGMLFIPLLQLMVRVQGATLHTLVEAIDDLGPYRAQIEELPYGARRILLNEFSKPTYAETRNGVRDRINQIIVRQTLDRMFSAPRNAVDIAQALNTGKIILVSTEVNYLRDLSPLFGRYIISRVISAALERAEVPREQRRQAYLYIDECKPYVDQKIEEILTTMREYGLGVMIAFQEVDQMSPYMSTILGNTAIKLMSSVSEGDARAFAADMETTPEFIRRHRKEGGEHAKSASFACYTRDLQRSIRGGLENLHSAISGISA